MARHFQSLLGLDADIDTLARVSPKLLGWVMGLLPSSYYGIGGINSFGRKVGKNS